MVDEIDIPTAVIDAQFRIFVKTRVHTTGIGNTDVLPEDVRKLVMTTMCLELFLDNIAETSRWN